MSLKDDMLHCRAKMAELKHRRKKTEHAAFVHFRMMRELLDPMTFDDDLTRIDVERLQIHLEEFSKLSADCKKIDEQIGRCERDLDG